MSGNPRIDSVRSVILSIGIRWLGFAVMTLLAVINESQPGTRIADPVLSALPWSQSIERINYWLWILAWIPPSLILLRLDQQRFIRLMLAGAVLSVLRGVSILATGLGPVRGEDVNLSHDWTWGLRFEVTRQILNPISVLAENSANIWLTKDLFFSGHTATTFLLLLYVWPYRKLRLYTLLGHAVVVASLFLGHIHYTIDVIGGYAAAAGVYWLFEKYCGLNRNGP